MGLKRSYFSLLLFFAGLYFKQMCILYLYDLIAQTKMFLFTQTNINIGNKTHNQKFWQNFRNKFQTKTI